MLPRSPGLVSRPGRTLRVRRWGVSKGWGRPGIRSLRWDREIRERGLSGVRTLGSPWSRWDVGRVSRSGRGRRGLGSRIGQGLCWAPGWRPGKASRGGSGIAWRRVSSRSRWISGSWSERIGKGGLGAGLGGSHVSHGARGSRERGRRKRSVGSGAGRKGWSRAVGQRESRRSRWEGLWWIRGNVRRRRTRRLRVPGALLGSLRLPHDLLQLLHSDPAQVGQLPHPGKLLQECLQGHLPLQELLSHFLGFFFNLLAFHLEEVQQSLRLQRC